MANLIIKPSAGGDLVIKSSDSSDAITVGTTGQTTFAENATLSGTANNLGTTTAGTLSSGVTFPAGHILQVVEKIWNDIDTVTGTTFEIPTGGSCPITPLNVNSHFLVTLHTQLAAHGGSPMLKIAGTASATTTTVVSSIGVSLESRLQVTKGGHENTNKSSEYMSTHFSHSFIHDPALSNLNTIYYNMLFANYNGSVTVYINRAQGADTGSYMATEVSSFIIMEIARSS